MPETASRSFELPQVPHSDCDQKTYPGENVGFVECSISTDEGAP